MKQKKILALGSPPILLNTPSAITHSANGCQDSSRVMATLNANCTVHCAAEDFNVNFTNHNAKSVRYRTLLCHNMCMVSCEIVSCPEIVELGSAWAGPQSAQSSVHVHVDICGDIIHLCFLCEVKITRTSLLCEEVMAYPKPERLLPIQSIPSVPTLVVFLVIAKKKWRNQIFQEIITCLFAWSKSSIRDYFS